MIVVLLSALFHIKKKFKNKRLKARRADKLEQCENSGQREGEGVVPQPCRVPAGGEWARTKSPEATSVKIRSGVLS